MATVTITDTDRQTIIGWEAVPQAGQEIEAGTFNKEYPSSTFANYKTNLWPQMVDIGINALRIEARLDSETTNPYVIESGRVAVNDNADPDSINLSGFDFTPLNRQMDDVVMPYKAYFEAQTGETLHLNLCIVDFQHSGFMAQNTPAEFAEFLLVAVQHLETNYGIIPNAIEPILEADNQAGNWDATKLSNNIMAASARLAANGYTELSTKFIAPSNTDGTTSVGWFQDMQSANAAVAEKMLMLSYHAYTEPNNTQRQTIFSTADAEGLKTGMLEFIGADLDMLLADLQHARVSMFQQFTIAYPEQGIGDSGAQYFEINTSTWAVTPYVRTKWLRHAFRPIRRGAVIKTTSVSGTGSGNIPYAIAFKNPNDTWGVVVRTTTGDAFDISGLPAGTYEIWYSSGASVAAAPSVYNQTQSNQTIGPGGSINVASIGANGVVTIVNEDYLVQPQSGPVITGGRGARRLLFG